MNNVKKSIGWCDWTINPVKGLCPVGCSYCYARRAYGRNCNATFRDKSIRYDHSVFYDIKKSKSGDKIFVGSTIDLFHPLVSMWTKDIIQICRNWQDRTFIFLTKCPEYLPHEWPDNCWPGVSVTDFEMYGVAGIYLPEVKSKVKIISFEPLLSPIQTKTPYGPYTPEMMSEDLNFAGINWVIIGAQTPYSPKTAPRIEWVREIVEAADKAGVPVFLKDNMMPLLKDCIGAHAPYWRITDPDNIWSYARRVQLRQEFPA
jgi:protein gp37